MNVLINELKAQRAATLESAKAIKVEADAEERDLTEEEQKRFYGLMAEYKRLGTDLEQREALESAEAELAESTGRTAPPQTPNAVAPISVMPRVEVMHRHNTLKAFTWDKPERDAYAAGRWVLGALFDHAESRQWCIEHGMQFTRALAEGVNPAGGFLVPDSFERAVQKLREAHGVFRNNAKLVNMASDTHLLPISTGNLTVRTVGENTAVTVSDPTWDMAQLTARKIATLTRISTEVNEDAIIDLVDDLAWDVGWAFLNHEDYCGFLGTGAAAYSGILGINVMILDGTHEISSVELVAGHDTFGEVDMADICSVIGLCPEYALPNAKFYCSGVFKAMVFDRLKTAAGGALVSEIAGSAPMGSTFLGYPIVVSSHMPAGPTTVYNNELMFLFGDLAQACAFGSRRGVTVKADSSRYLEYDQIAVLGTERFDINVHSLGTNAAAGPMLAGVGLT